MVVPHLPNSVFPEDVSQRISGPNPRGLRGPFPMSCFPEDVPNPKFPEDKYSDSQRISGPIP